MRQFGCGEFQRREGVDAAEKVRIALGVRQDGGTASMTVEGAVNAEVFRSYVREILLPTLKAGDILVMDNLSAHNDREALDLLKDAGVTVRFLPAYSPDLNPIEKFFAKLKHWLRKAAKRTVDAVYGAIADVLPLTTPTECSNYFAQAGYSQAKPITL